MQIRFPPQSLESAAWSVSLSFAFLIYFRLVDVLYYTSIQKKTAGSAQEKQELLFKHLFRFVVVVTWAVSLIFLLTFIYGTTIVACLLQTVQTC